MGSGEAQGHGLNGPPPFSFCGQACPLIEGTQVPLGLGKQGGEGLEKWPGSHSWPDSTVARGVRVALSPGQSGGAGLGQAKARGSPLWAHYCLP